MALLSTTVARAQFTTDFQTNTISVVSNWVGNGQYIVGSNTFANALRIISTGVLSNGSGIVGYTTAASNCTAIVTDANSTWTNRFDLYIGNEGVNARLMATNAGRVFDRNGFMGFFPAGSNGVALISGANSVWRNTTNLFIGYLASGHQLIVSNGAVVSDLIGMVGSNGNRNVATVTGAGSTWSNGVSLSVGYVGSENRLIVTNAGVARSGFSYIGAANVSSNNLATVTGSGSTWRNTNSVFVGFFGSSNKVAVLNSGVVNAVTSYIGENAIASNNVALIAGSGAVLSNSINLFVGYGGVGNDLMVTNGGKATNQAGTIGYTNSSVDNVAFIEGTGSVWSNSQLLYVGYVGSGNQLIVSNGATVFSGNGYVGSDRLSSNNTATVVGTGATWSSTNLIQVGYVGSSNKLVVANGGLVLVNEVRVGLDPVSSNNLAVVTGNGALLNTGNTIIGYGGFGNQLIVSNGAVVLDFIGNVGYTNQSSQNSALVTGIGSAWSNVTTTYVGFKSPLNELVVANGGLVYDNEGYIGANAPASNNSALVTGPGAAWDNAANLYIGYLTASNQLTIASGGRVSDSAGTIGFTNLGPRNVALVTGAGSVWSNRQYTYVGYNGAFNQLIVSNGGVVRSGAGYIGAFNRASNNVATVTGSGSMWTMTNIFFVGTLAGGNSLVISNGGTVIANSTTYVGYDAASDRNSVLVTGIGSLWQNNDLYVGYDGASNTVTIANGGQGTIFDGYNSDVFMGYNPGSFSNTIVVTGSGSQWVVANLYVGYSSRSNSLTIANGGSIQGVLGYVGYTTGSNNTALVVGAGSQWWNLYGVYVGSGGSRNSLVISNGGVVFGSAFDSRVGNGGGVSNSALIADSGSAWNSPNGFNVGVSSRGNSVVISNGGAVFGGYYTSDLGYAATTGADGSNNFAVITGTGSVWSNAGTFTIGDGSHSNRLTVALLGKLTGANVFVGNRGGTNNLLRLTNGLVQATLLTVNTNNYLTGSGTVTGTVLNNGTIDANINGATLTFNNLIKNNGALRSSGGGIIEFYGPVLNAGTTNFTGGTAIFHAGIFSSTGSTNSWIFAGSDLWETGTRWSRLVPPSPDDSLVLITNATTKTVSVTASTFSTAPNSVNNYNIVLNGPANVTNTLRIADTPAPFTSIYFTAGTNAILTVSNATMQVGAFGTGAFTAGGELRVEAGSQLDTTGVATSTVANATVSGLWTNTLLNIAANGRLIVTNGGKMSNSGDTVMDSNVVASVTGSNSTLNTAGSLVIGNTGNNNRFTIDGTNANVKAGSLSIGNGSSNQVTVVNGGILFTPNGTTLGGGGSNSVITISGSGSTWTNNSSLIVGYFGPGNQLVITNGGKLVNFAFFTQIGANTGASNNTVTVTGTNSVWNEVGSFLFYVGAGAGGNRLLIADGGSMTVPIAYVGANSFSPNNTATVTDPGSIWSIFSSFLVGGGAGNQLIVTNGGAVLCGDGYVGSGAAGSNNLVTVTGSNSLWRMTGTLYVGASANSNRLEIAGGSVRAGSAVIGLDGTNSLIRVSGGALFVTNAPGTAPLIVSQSGGPASLIVNGGSVTVDKLIVTNGANSIFTFNAGTINSKSAFVTNAQQFVVGNGASTATYHLLGGTHSFNNGLRVRNASFLTGCGTINGTVVIDAGGTVIADCSPLVFTGSVTNNGVMRAINGSIIESYGPVINNGVIVALDGGTNFHSGFINNGAVITSNSIPQIVSVTVAGADVQINFTTGDSAPYVVEYKTELTDTSWTLLTNITGNGGVMTATDPGAAALPQRFYRVRLAVP